MADKKKNSSSGNTMPQQKKAHDTSQEEKKEQKNDTPETALERGSHFPNRWILLIFTLLIIGGVYFAVTSLRDVQNASPEDSSDTAQEVDPQVQKEAEQLLKKLGKHMLLPEEETPIIATIEDAGALSERQAFYRDVENGDKLLIYPQSQRAIIYRPSADIIVNSGPIQVAPPAQRPPQSEASIDDAQ